MALRDQLTEPWGIVTAGLLGGLGGAVTAALAPAAVLGLPVGLGIAGAVYGVRVGLGALADRGPAGVRTPGLPRPRRGGPADRWLRRAKTAVAALRRQAAAPPHPALRAQLGAVEDRATGILRDLHRFAGQVTLWERAGGQVDLGGLYQEQAALERGLRELAPGPLRVERERALRAVTDHLDTAARLGEARAMLLTRMQSAVLGLEGLVARVAELLALHASVAGEPATGARLAELTADLEGLRAGLADAEELSRRALGDPAALD
jgi:hypothetical protein